MKSHRVTETYIHHSHDYNGMESAASTSCHDSRVSMGRLRRTFEFLRRASCHLGFGFIIPQCSRAGVAVAEEDWDTLLILDACRYDMFDANNHLDGTLSQRISRGSSSIEFLRENFADKQYHEIVYVSANPYVSRLADETFHDVIPVYEQWDDELQTVPPAMMTDAVRTAHDEYPHKRIIAHYMQPHYPFIGETGRRIAHRGYAPDGDYRAMNSFSIWTQLQLGIATPSLEEVRTAYRENLQIVLASVETLLAEIDGKIVITADHGNLAGERMWPLPVRGYGHYSGWVTPELIDVPWFEPPFETRRDIVCEPPVNQTTAIEDSVITERLRSLGYRE
jgi:hypothetical protein